MNENKIDAFEIFDELYNTFDDDTKISLWNDRCEGGYYEEDKIYYLNETELNIQFGNEGMEGEPYKLSVYDIINLDFSTSDKYFTNGIYPSSFNSDGIDERISVEEIFRRDEWTEDSYIVKDYIDEIKDLCGIEDDSEDVTLEDFITDVYEWRNLPQTASEIKADWERYKEDAKQN